MFESPDQTTGQKRSRLSDATSPYLLQHAHNPVDWYTWSDEAFSEARRRDVPVFLSIGYSTCYWCHVMERESFEDEATAKLLNARFVSITVDREERPDLDDLYMAATQVSTGGGGWPMSVFLDPRSRRPFFCGTYFPPEPRHGYPSFTEVLTRISESWEDRRGDVIEAADRLGDAVAEELGSQSEPVAVGEPQVSEAASMLLRMHDAEHGGFGRAPKFPQPSYVEFLLAVRDAGDDATRHAIDAVVRSTLDAMMVGGIHDHVGGGFHRYAVDTSWTVPHFEKMLYDNASLLALFARAGRVYDDALYKRVARTTLAYVQREMTHASGVFFSAQDAEVDGREGLNYLWIEQEIEAALDGDDAALAKDVYGIAEGPNFRDPHHPSEPARSVLRLDKRLDAIAAARGEALPAILEAVDRVNASLLDVRAKRRGPRLDDKVITAWNGLMIGALSRASVDLDERAFFDHASRAAGAVWDLMRSEDGGFRRSARPATGQVSGAKGVLEDYAFLAQGLLELARAEAHFGIDGAGSLGRARDVVDQAVSRFGNEASGGFFTTEESSEDLFVRPSSTYDGAMDSGVAVMINALIDLHELSGDVFDRDRGASALIAASAAIKRQPVSTVSSTKALFRALRGGYPLAERWVALGLDATPKASGRASLPSPVEVFASDERVTVTRDTPGTVSIILRIKDPYHVVAARPTASGDAGLIPFRIGVAGGTGIAVYADYPDGTPYRTAGVAPEIRVYQGQVEIELAIERVGKVEGRPVVVLGYQACTDAECLPPRNIELDVAIDTD